MLRFFSTIGIAVLAIGCGYYELCGTFPFASLSSAQECHGAFPHAVRHLSTKSPYVFDGKVSVHSPNGCTAQQVWMMVRHGTRNPSEEKILEMKERLPHLRDLITKFHKEGKGKLCDEDVAYLNAAKADEDLKESEQKYLVEAGSAELIGIASRFQERFPNLFKQKYTNDTFKFKYTKTQRAEASANAFATTLFGEDEHREVWYPTAVDADPVIRSYKGCKRWKQQVDKNPTAYKEQREFEKSDPFLDTIRDVSTRLGFETPLDFKDVELMYVACGFETSWNHSNLSPWCTPFREEDLKVMEYHQDIEYYWIDGYGFELTYKQSCGPVQDFVQHFDKKISHPNESPDVIAYFSHSGTNLKLIARLGLFKDEEPLRSDNFKAHANRKWKTSEIDKFASNLAIVLYKCPSNEYRVGALFQEKEVPLEGCEGNLTCPFDEFRSRMTEITHNCDMTYNEICRLQN